MKGKSLNLPKLHAAAWEFALNPDLSATEMSEKLTEQGLPIHPKTLTNWEKRPEWAKALAALGYTGEMSFSRKPTRDTLRDAGDLVVRAKAIYQYLLETGEPSRHAILETAKRLHLKQRRVKTWLKKGFLSE